MKTLRGLGICSWLVRPGVRRPPGDQAHATLPYAEIYQRATNEFAEAVSSNQPSQRPTI